MMKKDQKKSENRPRDALRLHRDAIAGVETSSELDPLLIAHELQGRPLKTVLRKSLASKHTEFVTASRLRCGAKTILIAATMVRGNAEGHLSNITYTSALLLNTPIGTKHNPLKVNNIIYLRYTV